MDFKKIPLYCAFMFLGACSLEAQMGELMGGASSKIPKLPPGVDIPLNPGVIAVEDPEIADFARSNIYVGSHGRADNTPLEFVIRMMNSDGSIVANYRPEYSVVSGTEVIKGDCTISDRFGLSFCTLKSSEPGVKVVRLENAKDHHPTQKLVFENLGREVTSVGDSGGGGSRQEASAPGGWKFAGSVGSQYSKQSTKGKGYQFILDGSSDIQ